MVVNFSAASCIAGRCRRADRHGVRLGSGELDHIEKRLGRQRGRRDQDERRLRRLGRSAPDPCPDRTSPGPLADQRAAGAGSVLDHHRLAEGSLQRRLQGARHRVGRAAGRKRHEKAERPVRAAARERCQPDGGCRQIQHQHGARPPRDRRHTRFPGESGSRMGERRR